MIDPKDIENLKEVFATKDDIENLIDIVATKEDMAAFRNEVLNGQDKILADVTAFKNEILGGQDKILTMLTTLTQEKIVEDEQEKRQKKVLEIHHGALKRGKLLSEKEGVDIDALQVF